MISISNHTQMPTSSSVHQITLKITMAHYVIYREYFMTTIKAALKNCYMVIPMTEQMHGKAILFGTTMQSGNSLKMPV